MSMADRDGVIWYDGELVQWRDATTHVLTHTLHYGMGVFEGVRAYNTPDGTAIFRLQAHTDRLFDSAHIMNMPMPYSKEEINEATRAAVRENNLESAYIRPMVFYGSEGMGLRASGLKVHVIVAAWHWGAYMGDEALELGIKVRTSSFTRHHVNITMTRAKSNGAYINSMLALQEAISGGADEALMLDPEGYVAEGTTSNVFVVDRGFVRTPGAFGILDGITRAVVLEECRREGILVEEGRISAEQLLGVEEAFITSSVRGIVPVTRINGQVVGDGAVGSRTREILRLYEERIARECGA